MQAQQLIYLSCFSIGILAAILLIQGAFQVSIWRHPHSHFDRLINRFHHSQLNRFMLIYWLVVGVLRIILQTLLLLEIFIYNILESSSYELLYTLLEVLDYGKPQISLATCFQIWFCCFCALLFLLVVLFTSFFLVWSLYKQLKHRDQNSFTRLQNEVW